MPLDPIDSIFDEGALSAQFKLVLEGTGACYEQIKKVFDLIQQNKNVDMAGFAASTEKLNQATEEMNNLTKKAVQSNEQLVASTKAAFTANEKYEDVITGVSKSYDENIRSLVKVKLGLEALAKEQQLTKKEMEITGDKTGELSVKMEGLAKQQVQLKGVYGELTRAVRLQDKDMRSAAGSVDELDAQYDLLWQTYRGLSAEVQKSPFGVSMRKQLEEMSNQLNETKKNAGNFSDNVGRYAGSLAKPFEMLINKLEELKQKMASGQGDAGTVQQIQAIEQGLAKASKETSTSTVQFAALTKTLTTLTLATDEADQAGQQWLGTLTAATGEAKDAIGDLKDEINLAASDTKGIDNAVGALNALAGVAQGAAGAYALFGASEEDAAVITSKLIAVQGIANSIQQVGAELTRKGTIANKAYAFVQGLVATAMDKSAAASARWMAVLKLTTIGLVVAAVGVLISMFSKASDAADELKEKQSDLKQSIDGAKDSYVRAVTEVNNLKTAFEQAKSGVISKEEAVKLYNETIGKTAGEVKTLDEAEQALAKNAEAYIRFTLLKAAANIAMGKAAEKAFEVQKLSMDELGEGEAKLLQKQTDAQKFRQSYIKGRKQEAQSLTDVAKSLLKDAEALSKEFKFDFNAISEPDSKSKKAAAEQKKLSDKTAQDILKSNFEKQKLLIDSAIKTNRTIFEDEKASHSERIEALNNFTGWKLALDNMELEHEKKLEEMALADKLDALEKQKKEEGANIQEINKQKVKEEKASAARVEVIYVDHLEKVKQIRSDDLKDRKDYLEKRYRTEEAFENQEKELEKKISDEKIRLNGLLVQAEKNDIDNRKKRLLDMEAYEADIEKRRAERRKQGYAEEQSLYKQFYDELRDTFFSFIRDSYEAEKNRIDSIIADKDEEKNKKIEAINSESISEQEKADKISVINATAQIEKERLEQRKRKIDVDRARFEKAANAAQIVASTAAAVIEAIKTFKGTPYAFTIAAIIGAIGALQLAKVLSTPIPKYRDGRGYGKAEAAIVGDGGVAEYIQREDGTIEKTPARDTLTFLNPKDRVFKNREEMMRELAMGGRMNFAFVEREQNGLTREDINGLRQSFEGIKIQTQIVTKAGWRHVNKRIADYDAWVNRVIKN